MYVKTREGTKMIVNNIDDIFAQFDQLKDLLDYFKKFDNKGQTKEELELAELMKKLGLSKKTRSTKQLGKQSPGVSQQIGFLNSKCL